MNVLSLFDGMSCGMLALQRVGIKVDKYYASEIDKYAEKVSKHHFPEIIRLGDITKIDFSQLRDIDLIIAGSPCQGFSFAGKQLNFDDPRSKLFFHFVLSVKIIKPKYFLLENVNMKKEFQDVISEQLGVQSIEIDSELVSAAFRKRLYWTNIPGVSKPERKTVSLMDILEYPSTLAVNVSSSGRGESGVEKRVTITDKALTLTASGYSNRAETLISCTIGSSDNRIFKKTKKLGCLTATMFKGIRAAGRPIIGTPEVIGKHIDEITKSDYRMLTPLECERCQTVPDNYTNVEGVSKSQRYKMLGNGWTVDVIAHILKQIKRE